MAVKYTLTFIVPERGETTEDMLAQVKSFTSDDEKLDFVDELIENEAFTIEAEETDVSPELHKLRAQNEIATPDEDDIDDDEEEEINGIVEVVDTVAVTEAVEITSSPEGQTV